MTDYKETRKVLAKLLNKLEPYDGKLIRKLGEESLSNIRQAASEADGYFLPQDIQTPHGKLIDLSGLRESLEQVEKKIFERDSLESCPALEEYREAVDNLIAAQNKLREESGMYDAEVQATRQGLVKAYLRAG